MRNFEAYKEAAPNFNENVILVCFFQTLNSNQSIACLAAGQFGEGISPKDFNVWNRKNSLEFLLSPLPLALVLTEMQVLASILKKTLRRMNVFSLLLQNPTVFIFVFVVATAGSCIIYLLTHKAPRWCMYKCACISRRMVLKLCMYVRRGNS